MSALTPGTAVDASTLTLTHEGLAADEIIAGHPTTAVHVLTTISGAEVGVWEMTPGSASDVEADEVFIVLSGRATISFDDPALSELEIGPGTVVHLPEGQRTVWTVSETLRKIYIL